VENLTARYSADGPIVLDKLSFHIKSGERIGVGEPTSRSDVIIFL
jgi:ABC-type bacteriocin/lantibiotic exporter with double-glycine peptidase domain